VTVITVAALAGCQADTGGVDSEAVFGDGFADPSRVVAVVDGYEITETMLDLRFEELNRQEKARFQGPEGRRLFLRRMVEELVRVREAERRQLHLDPTVSRVLIAQRRDALDLAMRAELIEDQEPDIDAVREYFEMNRDRYQRQGAMNASHIQSDSLEDAEAAYREVVEKSRAFGTVATLESTNTETAESGGDLGWFNRGGFIPFIRHSKEFTELVWGLETGVNPPLEYDGKWHVVKVNERRYGRPQTLEEAYDRVVADMLPDYQQRLINDWSREAVAATDVEYFAEFRPGQGKTAQELLERAFYTNDPEEKLVYLQLLVDDFPDSEYADDALFVAGNLVLDTWGDRRRASVYLYALVRRYPDSDYREDAQFILDNMDKPGMVQPKSIEELRELSR
jgi:parvulin-like peptidyl-prolyl isomerase